MSLPFYQIIVLLCGVALFLYGMQEGENNLKQLGGRRLRQIITAITRHRLAGYGTGFLTTLVTQSSSATTVMLVGLASVQLITLRQSLGVILGADLGTTMTVQLFAFKFYLVSPLLIAVGFAVSCLRKHGPIALTGKIVLALGLVFYGMQLMAEASSSLREHPRVNAMVLDSLSNPWIGLAAGMCITAIIQSSAATLAIAIAMAQYIATIHAAPPGVHELLPIVLGANVGTCATAFLAVLQAETEGVRVAWAHLLFKVVGTVLAFPFIWILDDLTVFTSWPIALQIAALHTAFNLFLAAIFLPLVPACDRLLQRLVHPPEQVKLRFQTTHLHEKVIHFPGLALSQAEAEIARIAGIVMTMVEESLACVRHYDPSVRRQIIDRDDEVDFLHDAIVTFLTGIARQELGPEEAKRASALLMIATDLEHIGDIVSKSIVEIADKIDRSPVPLSEEGKKELVDFFASAISLLRDTLDALRRHDRNRANALFATKPEVKRRFSSYMDSHLDRLYTRKKESLTTTALHIDLLEEIQRINHFTFRIANRIAES